jgi:hypothetical protein
MDLVIGTNSYVTLDEATGLLESYLVSTDPLLTTYKNLSENDKKVVLYKSCLDMQKLVYRGIKKANGQQLAFPRVNKLGNESDSEMVKLAQTINALSFIGNGSQEGNIDTASLYRKGITTFKLGQFSISLNMNKEKEAITNSQYSNSGVVEQLLKPWLQGSVRIL